MSSTDIWKNWVSIPTFTPPNVWNIWAAQIPQIHVPTSYFDDDNFKANKKAEELLMSLLNEEQKEDYRKFRWFYVEVNGEYFRVNSNRGVDKIDPITKAVLERYCIHPEAGIPSADISAAQKLLLEGDIVAFKNKANATRFFTRN